MKKITLYLTAVLTLLALSFSIAACGENGENGGNGDQNKGTLYSIQAPEKSDIYTVNNLPENAYEGDKISFQITLTHPEDSILHNVTLSGSTTEKQTLTAAENGTFTFVMPADAIKLTVSADYYPNNESDNFLAWDPQNETTISVWAPAFPDETYLEGFDDAKLTSVLIKIPASAPGAFVRTAKARFPSIRTSFRTKR